MGHASAGPSGSGAGSGRRSASNNHIPRPRGGSSPGREGEIADGRDDRPGRAGRRDLERRPGGRRGWSGSSPARPDGRATGENGGRGDRADALAVGFQGGAGRRAFGARLEGEPLQDLVDVPQGVDPGDGLLTEVAALDEADRPVVAGELLGQVLLGDVLAEDRRAGLDPQRLRTPTGSARSGGRHPRPPSAPRRPSRGPRCSPITVSPGIPAGDSRTIRTGRPAQLAQDVGVIGGRRGLGRRRRAPIRPLRRPPRCSSKVASERSSIVTSSNIPYLPKWARASSMPPGSERTRMRSSAARHDDVADRLALRAGDERLAAAARGEPLDLVGRQVVQELRPVRAGDLDPHPVRAVDQAAVEDHRPG